MTFRGWPPEALQFFAQLEVDNTKSFWEAHRDVYEECVRAPFLALSDEVADEFGPLRLFRPHRDVRFSPDKSPYKTAAGAMTDRDGGAVDYVQISASGLFLGSGIYALTRDQLERYRLAVADDETGSELATVVALLREEGYDVGGVEALATAPRGYAKDHPRVDLLRLKGCAASRSFGAPRWLHTRKALGHVVRAWRDATALEQWLDREVGPSAAPPARR